MKKIIAALVAVALLVILVVVILGGAEDECKPGNQNAPAPAAGGGGLAQPMEDAINHITSGYKSPERPNHRGVDIGKPNGEAIFALADGVVAAAGAADGFGQWIVIDHEIDGHPYSTVYGHMYPDGVHVKTGDQVKAGQHIADEGSNGQSSGPHLHFEMWEGSRLRGGNETDPTPWIERAAQGGGAAAAPEQAPEKKPQANKDEGGELPPSDKIASEDHLQVDSIRLARAVAQRFPEIQTIGGWRPNDPYPDHPSGRAVDIMIPNYSTGEGKALGDAVKDYVYGNREFFHVQYMIWRQEYIPAAGASNMMEDRGSDTQNHFDHVHVTTEGHGFPTPDQKFGPAPEGGSAAPSAAADDGCVPKAAEGVDEGAEGLNEGAVPPEFVKWLKLGGNVCPEITPALLAGQQEQESQFNVNAGSPAGAQGPAQFMPGTWATWGRKVDDNGEPIGPPGSGDIRSPADATMAQARLMCEHASVAKRKVESGAWHGDLVELALAAYNAGEGNVDSYGGVPPFAETQHYVKTIPEKAQKYQI